MLCWSCIRVSCKYADTLACHLSRQAYAPSVPNHLPVTWLELAPNNMVGQEIPGSSQQWQQPLEILKMPPQDSLSNAGNSLPFEFRPLSILCCVESEVPS